MNTSIKSCVVTGHICADVISSLCKVVDFTSTFQPRCLPTEAVTIAAAVGACSMEAPDALSGIRFWDETLARVEQGWSRRALAIDTPGWYFDEGRQLWLGPNL